MRYSIVPDYLKEHKIQFFNKSRIKINVCDFSKTKRYSNPFQNPFLIINLFAQKTTKPPEIVEISFEELKSMGFSISSLRIRDGWFWGQRKKYRIEPTSNRSMGAKRMNGVPPNHHIEKDLNNNCIRLFGTNAGRHKFGEWIKLGVSI